MMQQDDRYFFTATFPRLPLEDILFNTQTHFTSESLVIIKP